jgi:recombination protein RecT
METLPATQKKDAIAGLLSQESIRSRFEQVLGKKAAGFMSSVISAVNSNSELKKADPMTVISAAAVAASLDLPINPSLGFAHIVPYKKDGVPIAQFQMGWRGFVQLGMRSGQYRTLNVCPVYEGELTENNRFTGEMHFDEKKKTSDKIIGYVAYFKLLNGFEKYLYMTVEQVMAHGKRYSKSFGHENGKWKTDPEAMSMKTVLKMLLSKFGILSIEMQSAVQYDQSVIKNMDGKFEYSDNPEKDETIIDAEPEAIDIAKFDSIIPADIDRGILDEFLMCTAESNKTTVAAVKESCMENPKAFWKIVKAFQKQIKAKEVKEPKMAKSACPDSPENIYNETHCKSCGKREGCSAW